MICGIEFVRKVVRSSIGTKRTELLMVMTRFRGLSHNIPNFLGVMFEEESRLNLCSVS